MDKTMKKKFTVAIPLATLVSVFVPSSAEAWFAPQVDQELKSPEIKIAQEEDREVPLVTEGVLALSLIHI